MNDPEVSFKVLRTDNFARETVADKVVAEYLTERLAKQLCEYLQSTCASHESD
jgi:hypothetical protein